MKYVLYFTTLNLIYFILPACSLHVSPKNLKYTQSSNDNNTNKSEGYKNYSKYTSIEHPENKAQKILPHKNNSKVKTLSKSIEIPVFNKKIALDKINTYRKKMGLNSLKLDKNLVTAALNHSNDMANSDLVSHLGSDGSDPWKRVLRTGYPAEIAAENIGAGQYNFENLLDAWKKSPGHNKNLLLTEAEDIGLALVHNKYSRMKTYWTLILAKKRQ